MEKLFQKPQNLFLIICLFWGLLFGILNPPFQAPDEDSHLYKIYGITQGSLNFKKYTTDTVSGTNLGKKLTFSGQYLPSGLITTARYNKRVTFQPSVKTSFDETRLLFRIPLNKTEQVFIGYPTPSYTPLSYMPAVFVIWILSLIKTPAVWMLFAGRLCSLAVYLAICYYAIKITPVQKWLFMVIMLMPMVVYEASALSTDALTNSLSFLLVAFSLRLAFDENVEKISKKQNITFLALTLLLTICKFTYAPLAILYLLIPNTKFHKTKDKYLTFAGLLFAELITILMIVSSSFIVNAGLQSFSSSLDKTNLIKFMLLHPIKYFELILKSIQGNAGFYTNGLVGLFGWSDTYLPKYCVLSYLFLITFTAFSNFKSKAVEIGLKSKIILFVASLLSVLLVMTSCYLIFMPENNLIEGVQGRYFIPILPVAALLFCSKKFQINSNKVGCLILFAVNFILFVSLIRIIARFYL